MKVGFTVALSMLAGAVLGAAAVQGLHAQAQLPAYQVIEVEVTNPDLYKEYQAKAMPLQIKYSARFIARGGRVESFAGEGPKRAVIAVYDSMEKLQALRDAPEYRAIESLRDQSSKYRSYLVEGAAN